MKNLGLHEIRREYLEFFKSKEHLILPSFSLIPKNDKSLLLIGAGMAPLKKYFTGELTPPNNRLATCQKCIRTGDIENVGKTDRHATFFEMLGNFSFGDYFKKEAIEWAWEFLTVNLEIPKEDLWVTIYLDDDEAHEIWKNVIGVPEEKIVRLGKEDNFWELEVGPSGPCSEIYVDRGKEYGCGCEDCKPGCDCDRFIEVWNLVFTQFDKDEKGVYHPLPNPNIDTGMGLERIATVLQKTNNIFEIDAIQDILKKIEELANYEYGTNPRLDQSIRVITDHIRAITFLVSDLVRPSNEGRGYVLRRLIRRAARHGILLSIRGSFLYELADIVIDSWGEEYSELAKNRETIKAVILKEEEKFLETLDQGVNILNEYIKELKKNIKDTLSGKDAFKLYDTFGFPVDLTEEILREQNLKVDISGFEKNMEDQRERARKARDTNDSVGWSHSENEELFKDINSTFIGYEHVKTNAKIVAIFSDGKKVSEVSEGEKAIIFLDNTPFYGESGGQVGDTGKIYNEKFICEVLDTKKTKSGKNYCILRVEEGLLTSSEVTAEVDEQRRNAIRRNHSVTHLLHKALKEVVGDHVNQAGSEVLDNRLRFDFTNFEAISKEDLNTIEKLVNEKIYSNLNVETIVTTLPEAMELGALGLFEEKYGDEVRIVKMGDFSMELCGGTHVSNTSEIGMFKILSEGGISSGVRRIEAITGLNVYEYLTTINDHINNIAETLKTNKVNILKRIMQNIDMLKEKSKELENLKHLKANDELDEIINNAKEINGINLALYDTKDVEMQELRDLADKVRDKLDSAVVLLASTVGEKVIFVCTVSKNLIEKGIKAGDLVRAAAEKTGGSGGGRPDMATAGGKDKEKIREALNTVKELINKI